MKSSVPCLLIRVSASTASIHVIIESAMTLFDSSSKLTNQLPAHSRHSVAANCYFYHYYPLITGAVDQLESNASCKPADGKRQSFPARYGITATSPYFTPCPDTPCHCRSTFYELIKLRPRPPASIRWWGLLEMGWARYGCFLYSLSNNNSSIILICYCCDLGIEHLRYYRS